MKRQAPLPPLDEPAQCSRDEVPDISAISFAEWHSATEGQWDQSVTVESGPLGPDARGDAGCRSGYPCTLDCLVQSQGQGIVQVLQTIAEETGVLANGSVLESPHLAGLFSPDVRVLDAASNGDWTSDEEREDLTMVEITPTVSALLQPVPPSTRQSRVNLPYMKRFLAINFCLKC